MQAATAIVAETIRKIEPLDDLEREHIDTTLAWLAATDDIFRRVRPATPPRHLVAYVVLVDPDRRAVFLGHHLNAGLWLPTGGHVEPGEHPLTAARREAFEELGVHAEFSVIGDRPLMLTVTTTVGIDSGHQDVSAWYVIRGDRSREYALDPTEFAEGRWWDIDQHGLPETDPHFKRFLTKLDTQLHGPDNEL
ncbi:NUDIX domain-containing protein [Nocardia sp. NBC_00881]|uniref:NUDIX hydrolase n=1 Tax=Nocardia sp. NBC_00881 TaxID=2975995 RepID=UPI00386940B5|nr:NUDIX domain-containing protein [Nocardia sp. NBC_00881]